MLPGHREPGGATTNPLPSASPPATRCSTPTPRFPPGEAESLGIRQIFGWSDAVVNYMKLKLVRGALALAVESEE